MMQRKAALIPIREYADLGQALLDRRVELDATRREIEGALGWPRGRLAGIERNRKCLSDETAGPLLDLLGLQLRLHADGAPYAVCKTYGEWIISIDYRRKQLHLTMEVLNEVSGLQEGYVNKVLVGIRGLGPVSLPSILGALRLQLYIEPRARFRWEPPEPAFIGVSFASYIHLAPAAIPSTIEASPL